MLVDTLAEKLNSRRDWNAKVVRYSDLTDEHVNDVDLCISMGGTNTFLKTAMHIKDPTKTAILGILSPYKFDKIVDGSHLCTVSMNVKNH